MPTRAEIVARYGERTGVGAAAWTFYEVFGLFRLAAIAQQIYYRYHHGQTRNPAFKRFWVAAHLLERRCRRLIRPLRTSPRTTASATRTR
jgi:aminoglycoside phosphotransferase (APT) family kinase protein